MRQCNGLGVSNGAFQQSILPSHRNFYIVYLETVENHIGRHQGRLQFVCLKNNESFYSSKIHLARLAYETGLIVELISQ